MKNPFFLYFCLLDASKSNDEMDFSPREVLKSRYEKIRRSRKIKKLKKRILKFKKYDFNTPLSTFIEEDLKYITKKSKKQKVPYDLLFNEWENYGSILDFHFLLSYMNYDFEKMVQALFDFNFDFILHKIDFDYDKKKINTLKKENIFILLHIQLYLRNFLCRAYPKFIRRYDCLLFEEKDFEFMFCYSCKDLITKSVWPFHLTGKKHLKRAKETEKPQSMSENKKIKDKINFLIFESQNMISREKFIKTLYSVQILSQQILIKNIKTFLAMLQDEHITAISMNGISQENIKKRKILKKYIIKENKLKIKCEICNELFTFSKKDPLAHFITENHFEGLEKLGVKSDFKLFEGFTTVENVKKMIKRLSEIKNKD